MLGVRARSSCRECIPGVRAGSSCLEALPRVCARSYTGPSGGSGFVLLFVLFGLFAAIVDPGGDSVHTGLPVLVSSRAGDCGRLLLILVCCYLAEFVLVVH